MNKQFIFVILLLFSNLLFSQEKIKVAVLPFSSINEEEGDTISSIFANELSKRKVYTVLTRNSRMEKVMKELNFQRNGLTDENTIAEIGKALNAQYVMTGEIAKLGRSSVLVVSMINVETLENITGDTKTFKNIEDVLQYVPQMVNEITGTRGVTIYDTDLLGDTTKRVEPTSGAKDALEKVIRKREGERHVDKIESLVIRGIDYYYKGAPFDITLDNGRFHKLSREVTSLMIAAAYKYNDILQALVDAGADVNLTDKEGSTALTYCILSGNLEGANILLNNGASIDNRDDYLYDAIEMNNTKMVRLLVQNGADINRRAKEERFYGGYYTSYSTLSYAVMKNNYEILKILLLNGGNIHTKEKSPILYTAVLYARMDSDRKNNTLNIIRTLLNAGADIDVRSNLGSTPLLESCEKGYTDIVKLLIEYGADVNYSDKYGKKPLKVARDNDIVRLLIDAGAEE